MLQPTNSTLLVVGKSPTAILSKHCLCDRQKTLSFNDKHQGIKQALKIVILRSILVSQGHLLFKPKLQLIP